MNIPQFFPEGGYGSEGRPGLDMAVIASGPVEAERFARSLDVAAAACTPGSDDRFNYTARAEFIRFWAHNPVG